MKTIRWLLYAWLRVALYRCPDCWQKLKRGYCSNCRVIHKEIKAPEEL